MHHVEHLASAIDWGMTSIMERYARWLQTILVTRGMCTRHLADTFAALAAAITERKIDESGLAVEYLYAAQVALLYPSGAARVLQDRAGEIADRATAAIYRLHPEWEERWGAAGRERCADDLLYHLSYLADATALDRQDLFVTYAVWIASFLEERGIQADHMHLALEALADEIRAAGPSLQQASAILAAGRAGLRASEGEA
jgi:hypothetical protein